MAPDPPRYITFAGHPAEFDQMLAEAVERARTASTLILFTRDPKGDESKVLGGTLSGPLELAVLCRVALDEVMALGLRAAEAIPDPTLRAAALRDFRSWRP